MRRAASFTFIIVLVLSSVTAGAVMGHEGDGEAKIEVEPTSVTAGETVVLAGSGLEPDNDRVLVLAGGDLVVEFGTIRTDAEGMFSKELVIPSHLPSGTYELRAIGDETVTATLSVTAAAGGAELTPGPNDANGTVVTRDRSPIETTLIFAFVAVATILGSLLVWRAERFRGVCGI